MVSKGLHRRHAAPLVRSVVILNEVGSSVGDMS